MSGIGGVIESDWWNAKAPTAVNNKAAAPSGTIQTASANLNKLHYFTCPKACYLYGGSGSSLAAPTAVTGFYWPADTAYPYIPTSGFDALAYATADASSAVASSAVICRSA